MGPGSRLPQHRHRGALRERGRRRLGDPRQRRRSRGRLRDHQGLERRPGLRVDVARIRRQPRASRVRLRRPLPRALADPLAHAGDVARHGSDRRRQAARGQSAYATTCRTTWTLSRRSPTSRRRSTRSSSIHDFSVRTSQRYCAEHSIVLEAWAPIMRGGVLTIPEIVADRHGPRTHARTDLAAVDPPEGPRRDSQVRPPRPHSRERGRLRLRALGRGDVGHRCARHRRAHRTRPQSLRRPLSRAVRDALPRPARAALRRRSRALRRRIRSIPLDPDVT